MARSSPRILLIEARFYDDIADELARGAIQVLQQAGAQFERLSVPGVLELPAALALAVDGGRHDGFVLLGCVIRGETSHYDIVANESARAIMDLAVAHRLALGNGVLTVENGEQAWARASTSQKNKGAAAALAALHMLELKTKLANPA